MYERAPGDKVIPSDLRPPLVLKVRAFLGHFLIGCHRRVIRQLSTTSSVTFWKRIDFLPLTISFVTVQDQLGPILRFNTRKVHLPSNVTNAVSDIISSQCIFLELETRNS